MVELIVDVAHVHAEIDQTSPAVETKTLSVFVVRNVTNAAAVRAEILSGASAETSEAARSSKPLDTTDAAFIDATVVPSLEVIQAAAGMACQNLPALKTKTLHAELVWSLSGSKHIGRALSTFGIQDSSTHVLVAKFDATEEELGALRGRVHGEVVEGWDAVEAVLGEVCDVDKVRKVYTIRDDELKIGTLVEGIVSRIAARDCLL